MCLSAADRRDDGAAADDGATWLFGQRPRITSSVFHWAANRERDDNSGQLAKLGLIFAN